MPGHRRFCRENNHHPLNYDPPMLMNDCQYECENFCFPHELRVEYCQMLAQSFFTYCKADKGSRHAGGLYRLAAGQLATLKQETD